MPYEIRRVDASDTSTMDAIGYLRAEAFGPNTDPAAPRVEPLTWAAYSDDGALVGATDDHPFDSVFGGTAIPTAGIGGVAVAPEFRGGGVAMELMSAVLRAAKDRGAILSTLFGAAPALYRRLGYGMAAHSYQWRIPMAKLGGVRRSPEHVLCRAVEGDRAEMEALYASLAAAGTAMADDADLTFAPAPAFAHTVARDAKGVLVGFCSWRTVREASGLVLDVRAIHAATPEAYRSLVWSLGSWTSTVDYVTLMSVDTATVWSSVPGVPSPSGIAPYMLRVLDPASAVANRRWNTAVAGSATVELRDPVLTENSRHWQLTAASGGVALEPTTGEARTAITSEGFALWFAGVATSAELRQQGLLTGDSDSDALLDALAAQPRPSVTRFF